MRNRLLRHLSASDLQAISPHLVPVELPLRSVIMRPAAPIEHIYFIEEGLASVVEIAGSDRIEVGVIGREGYVGLPLVLSCEQTSQEAFMQAAGSGLRMSAASLRSCMKDRPDFAEVLLRFVGVQLTQVAQTALANGRYTVEQRLSRWLLMAHDRLEQPDLSLTHDFLALMLGVRRPGVTVSLHILEGLHAIRSRRGRVTILDREVLKRVAGAAYGPTEAAYERSFGTRPVAA